MNNTIFETTLEGLERGLLVQHIAALNEELFTCQIDDQRDLVAIFDDSQCCGFDQIPVRAGKSIVGVVLRGSSGKIEDNLHRLSEANLVSGQEPLTRFIPLMAETSYRLVLQGGSITGCRVSVCIDTTRG